MTRVLIRLTALAAVTLVGAGACAFGPRQDDAGEGGAGTVVDVVEEQSGASAAPGTDPAAVAPPDTSGEAAGDVVEDATGEGTDAGPQTVTTASGGCPQGPNQKQVEKYLNQLGGFGKLKVDGKQSPADCKAIKKFQKRYGISPAAGRAGPTTLDVARRLAKTDTSRCHAGSGTTFCVNLTLQTVWAMRNGKVVMKPTVTRTGKGGGYQTPAGTFHINRRNKKEWSNPYKVWLPYWQHFYGGMGFHETTTYIHNKAIGSHGCVNLLHTDAVNLYKLGKIGTKVYIFGRRPGT